MCKWFGKRRAEGSPPYETDLTYTVGRGALRPAVYPIGTIDNE